MHRESRLLRLDRRLMIGSDNAATAMGSNTE